jgi:hypothetical protein
MVNPEISNLLHLLQPGSDECVAARRENGANIRIDKPETLYDKETLRENICVRCPVLINALKKGPNGDIPLPSCVPSQIEKKPEEQKKA